MILQDACPPSMRCMRGHAPDTFALRTFGTGDQGVALCPVPMSHFVGVGVASDGHQQSTEVKFGGTQCEVLPVRMCVPCSQLKCCVTAGASARSSATSDQPLSVNECFMVDMHAKWSDRVPPHDMLLVRKKLVWGGGGAGKNGLRGGERFTVLYPPRGGPHSGTNQDKIGLNQPSTQHRPTHFTRPSHATKGDAMGYGGQAFSPQKEAGTD